MSIDVPPTQTSSPPPPPADQQQGGSGSGDRPAPPPPWWAYPPRRRSLARRIFLALGMLVLVLSILLNIELAVLLVAGAAGGLDSTVTEAGPADQTVAVFAVQGVIDNKTTQQFFRFYQVVRDEQDIKAVVIRIDSGGGGVSASDRIHGLIKAISEDLEKPVVVSMGAVAASGGYYIATGADIIYAEPTTMTGSIGVVAVWPVFKGLMDKQGIEVVTLRSSQSQRWKLAVNFWERPEAHARKNILELLDAFQSRFEATVKEGRGEKLKLNEVAVTLVKADDGTDVTFTEVEPLNGRVYLADQAKEFGLIDRIGHLDDAVKTAAEEAGLQTPRVVRYTRRKTLREHMGLSAPMPVIDAGLLDKLMTPRILMIWKAE